MARDVRSTAEMRKAVTSPGGTTEAALGVLDGDDGALHRLVREAVAAAARRAGELTD
ncbi:MAG: pyrroline-5-carboxylate reductase dimerization domain-containing protein [Parvularculaceae bacterium]